MYNEPVGQLLGGNLRNRVAHGLLRPSENNQYIGFLVLVDLLRIITRFNAGHFKRKYGIPAVFLDPTLDLHTVISSYRDTPNVGEDDILEFVKDNDSTIHEISEHFDLPYELTYVKVMILEALDRIEVSSTDGNQMCSTN
jgi:hypothetical protein